MTSFALTVGQPAANDDGLGRFFERLAYDMFAAYRRAAPRAVSPTEDHNSDATLLAHTALLQQLVDPEEERKSRRQQGLPDLGGLRIQWAGPSRLQNVNDTTALERLEKLLGRQSLQQFLIYIRNMGLGLKEWDIFARDSTESGHRQGRNGTSITRPRPADLLLALEG